MPFVQFHDVPRYSLTPVHKHWLTRFLFVRIAAFVASGPLALATALVHFQRALENNQSPSHFTASAAPFQLMVYYAAMSASFAVL